jgi:FkbM family methyltransferase
MNLSIQQKAVSNSCGQAWFETAHGYDGTSKLTDRNGPSENRFPVETITLDTVLAGREVALMKIDVEGFECEVIQGGIQCLEKTEFVIMEAEKADYLSRVTAALGKGWEASKVGATDYLFTHLRP